MNFEVSMTGTISLFGLDRFKGKDALTKIELKKKR